jgi:hypothetical protein
MAVSIRYLYAVAASPRKVLFKKLFKKTICCGLNQCLFSAGLFNKYLLKLLCNSLEKTILCSKKKIVSRTYVSSGRCWQRRDIKQTPKSHWTPAAGFVIEKSTKNCQNIKLLGGGSILAHFFYALPEFP